MVFYSRTIINIILFFITLQYTILYYSITMLYYVIL